MSSNLDEQIKQLKHHIRELEAQRGILGDETIEAALIPLKNKLSELESQVEQAAEITPAMPTRQRKLVTLLYLDVVNSTAMTHDLDPEDTMEIMEKAILRLAAPIEAHGGRITRYTGDGFKAIFGDPVAREDDPEQAIRAGLQILDACKEIAKQIEQDWGIEGFQVRVGVDTGLAALGGFTEGQDTVKGRVVNLGVRIESAAPAGGLLISHNTYRHARGVFDVEPQEPINAKGFPELVPVYLVKEIKPRAFRVQTRGVEGVETRMVGRQTELIFLQDGLMTAIEEGEGQVVTISGEAGVGKSRLLYEFQNWFELLPQIVLLFQGRGRQESQAQPYSMLRDLFTFRFQILDDDTGQQARQKIESGFCEVFGQDEAGIMRAHILGQLLGFDFSASPQLKGVFNDPEQLRNRGVMYLVQYFQAIAHDLPVVIFLEDIHWGDDSSLNVVSKIGEYTPQYPIVIVSAARPQLLERRPYWGEGQPYHTYLELRPLSKRESRQLVAEILKLAVDIPAELRELIVQGAEGNPFYTEELIKMLIEDGVVIPDEETWQINMTRLEDVDVPSTLAGVLQARLDSLPQHERTVLQQASVVGRLFWDRIVAYIQAEGGNGDDPQKISQALTSLRNRELVYRHEESAFVGAVEYLFKHDVLREVTYESVIKRLRQNYHGLVADWLINNSLDRIGEYYGLIANHLQEAGEREEGLRYLKLAGRQAAKRYANQEAVSYFSQALELLSESDLEARFDLLLAREEILSLQANREAQRQDLETLELLADRLASDEKQMEVGVRWMNYLWLTREYQTAITIGERILIETGDERNLEIYSNGQLSLARSLILLEQNEIAHQHLNQALDGFNTLGYQRMVGVTLRTLGMLAANLGDLQFWQEYAQQALAIARQVGDRRDEAEAINHLGNVAGFLGDYINAEAHFNQYLSIVREIGSRHQEGMALENLGWVANDLKDHSTALKYYEKSLVISQEIRDRQIQGGSLVGLGDALAGSEKWELAVEAYLEALEVFEEYDSYRGIAASYSGLARVAVAQMDKTRPKEFIDSLLEFLGRDTGFYDLCRENYLTCVQVLQAVEDPRSAEVLEIAYVKVQERAKKIKDEALRRSFLENVPYNRELVKLWQDQQEI